VTLLYFGQPRAPYSGTSRLHAKVARPGRAGLPPEKWSSLMYGFEPDGGLEDGEEETHGGGDRREAAAG
jgi:hypothetical protein